jgi:predicted ATPase/DNA-binding winged helix-turn-helix (wHTH) protein
MTLTYRFGRFELRPATRQLLVDEQPAALGARAFDLLLALIERRDRLVTKNELLDLVWPGLVVEENNLQVQVSALRKLLGLEAIATVAGHGYRFTLESTQVGTPPPTFAKHNLPAQVSSFIGRERELLDLRAMLTRHRLVTLAGVGGIGKTRLALELAAIAAHAYADGVWFVDLAKVSDPRLVANAVASSFGVREEAGRPAIDTLREFATDRTLLIILDNCEHLLLACAQLGKELLQAGQRVTIVATSREPLHVPGEATFPVAPLPVPAPGGALSHDAMDGSAAVRLFVDRASAVRPDFALTRKNTAAVAQVCRDLDGIPLALELAAARVRAMSVEAIVEHLTDRFALLKGGDRTALPRQQTLRATIDWSYDLLAPQERALLRRLSVFAGGFALDAAEAVGSGDDVPANDVLDLLGHLVDKSLIAFDAQVERYRMLETVRQYALARLTESGGEPGTRDRHLEFYVALAEHAGREIYGPKQATWHKRLNAEREDVLLAFTHARVAPGGGAAGLTLVYALNMWLVSSDIELWHRVTLEALAHPDAQREDAVRGRALYVAAFIAYLTGRYDDAFALGQASVRAARISNNPVLLGDALYRLGIAAIAVDRLSDAREHFLEGLALARQTGERQLVMSMSCGLGELYSQQDRFELAEPAYLEALACSRGDPQDNVLVLHNLARNAIAIRAHAKALQYLLEAIATAEPQYSIQTGQAFLMNCAGLVALHEDWTLALRLSGAAESHKERHGIRGDYVDARFHARNMAPAREALGAPAADAAFAAGRALNDDSALREAEAWLEALAADESTP